MAAFPEFSFEVDDELMAVGEVGDGLPGALLEGVALPLDAVEGGVVVLAALQDLLHLPLLLHSAHPSIALIIISNNREQGIGH